MNAFNKPSFLRGVALSVIAAGFSLAGSDLLSVRARAEVPAQPKTETFRVGNDVYVRSLEISESDGLLWAGTSIGVLEIDLATDGVKNTYTREHGLANEYVFAMKKHSDGTLWFGTNAGGVSTLKDDKWNTIFPMHGLADYWVYSFDEQPNGDLWIGTWDGANHVDAKTGKFTTYRKELINIWVYGLDHDEDGNVWFGTEGGVSMFDGTNWKSWTSEDGLGASNTGDLPVSENTGLGTKSRHDLDTTTGGGGATFNSNYVFSVEYDEGTGHVWFGTWGGGVSRFDRKGEWTSFTAADGLGGNVVYAVEQGPDGVLWFGTSGGLSRYDGKDWATYKAGFAGPHVYAIDIEDDGTVWAATRGGVTKLSFRKAG